MNGPVEREPQYDIFAECAASGTTERRPDGSMARLTRADRPGLHGTDGQPIDRDPRSLGGSARILPDRSSSLRVVPSAVWCDAGAPGKGRLGPRLLAAAAAGYFCPADGPEMLSQPGPAGAEGIRVGHE